MKKFLILLGFLSVWASCNKEDVSPLEPGQVIFSYAKKAGSTGGRAKDVGLPAFASYTITKADGSAVNSKIELYEFNGSFVTQPQQLFSGQYTLDQFLILDAANKTIYVAPLQESDLANLVERPLPLPFSVVTGQETNVVPEVLALEDHTPEEFGYVAFGFEVVAVAALRIPGLQYAEQLEKISYQFSNANETITGEVSPESVLTIPELQGKTWQATIQLWAKKECTQYQKLYRFTGQLSFDGGVIRLPSLDHTSWIPFSYQEVNYLKIFRSYPPNFYYEFHLPPTVYGYGFVDRTYWDLNGNPLCQTEYMELSNSPDGGIIRVNFPDITCELTESSYEVDSFMTMTTNTPIQIQSYFSWSIKEGVAKPSACTRI